MTKSLLPVEQSIFIIRGFRGGILVWLMNREDHLSGCGSIEYTIPQTDDGVHRFGVCGVLGEKLVVGLEASFYALGTYICSLCISTTPLL